MPVAVMADSAFSFKKLLDQCENQELEAPGGIATPPVYGQLLALYLLHNDMNNARYLWKRIPPAIKSANSELGGIWSVGQRIWQRDFPGIYTTIGAHQWSETVQPIMDALRDATRRRAFTLVSQAYTSIVAEDFAAFVGLPVEEAVKDSSQQDVQAAISSPDTHTGRSIRLQGGGRGSPGPASASDASLRSRLFPRF
ncbi:COP9 signalosome complex subunit 8 isoform X2 [Pteropus alecto]|uniref:COP9 signalosome complex subunit 8 isoform X2 n=1 Tax=Pteropus alecto TaxID=9402 RepID=UPI000D539885|nr:COP9 signalosome complex subunit 8 isoform X2 [Pteropus alecto]